MSFLAFSLAMRFSVLKAFCYKISPEFRFFGAIVAKIMFLSNLGNLGLCKFYKVKF